MIRLALSVLLLIATTDTVLADWQLYKEDNNIIASVDYLSYESFHNRPSVLVRWHYRTPRNGVGGLRIQFTADCAKHRLFEIAAYPYDVDGKYLKPHKKYNSPIEYPIVPGSLNDETYKLLCHGEKR